MFVVVFEVQPKPEQFARYLELARMLRPELEQVAGFVDNERYRSTMHPERILSLSTWRDEKALIRWRTHAIHHKVQEEGRSVVFQNYRLRVGEVRRDTLPPPDLHLCQQRFDETESSLAKTITITEFSPAAEQANGSELDEQTAGLLEHEAFESIYTPGKKLVLASWRDSHAASAYTPQPDATRYREVCVIRAYGMFDRSEAPQYYPAVKAASESAMW